MKPEASSFEFDPGYDPERPAGDRESTPETGTVKSSSSSIPIIHIEIPEYVFDNSTNPFAWDADEQLPIDHIANEIDKALKLNFNMNGSIVRGIKSGQHKSPRDKLIGFIIEKGSDRYQGAGNGEIFATEYTDGTVTSILGGLHVYKPKSEERPQYPADVWMIFDQYAFDKFEYLHPRHNVIAKDKWRPKGSTTNGLRGILVIN